MTHTPGPWRIMDGNTSLLHVETDEGSPAGTGIAITSINKRDEANARLIAAAPEMLAALLTLLNTEGPATAAAQVVPAFKGFDAKSHYDKARAVLAKINDA